MRVWWEGERESEGEIAFGRETSRHVHSFSAALLIPSSQRFSLQEPSSKERWSDKAFTR